MEENMCVNFDMKKTPPQKGDAKGFEVFGLGFSYLCPTQKHDHFIVTAPGVLSIPCESKAMTL